jgi:hypothetical protein
VLGQPNDVRGDLDRLTIDVRERPEESSTRQASGRDHFLDLRAAEQRRRTLWNIANAKPIPEVAQGRAEQSDGPTLVGE